MTHDQQDEFVEHMRAGMRRGAAAELMELTRIEVQSFIRENGDFEARVLDAEEMATEHVEEALYQAAVSGSVPAAKLWLERNKVRHLGPVSMPSSDDAERPAYAEDELEAILRMTTD